MKNTSLIFVLYLAVIVLGLGPVAVAQEAGRDELATAPVHPLLAQMNQNPIRVGNSFAVVSHVSLIVNSNYPPGAPTLWVADTNRRLPSQFVEHDPRRGDYVGLGWTFDARHGTAYTFVNGAETFLTPPESAAQARTAFDLWTSLTCYSAITYEVPYPYGPGFENIEFFDDFILGPEPQPFRPVAEVTVAGFYPYTFFRQVYGGPYGDNILAFELTYSFYDWTTGQWTDIDGNGKYDSFWTEIYLNDLHYWGDAVTLGPNIVVDLETVALHEMGHSFGLDHFGRGFENHGGVIYAAGNVMSSRYVGPYRQISGTPSATFCGIYGSWD